MCRPVRYGAIPHRCRRRRRLMRHVLGRGHAETLGRLETEGAAQVDEADLQRSTTGRGRASELRVIYIVIYIAIYGDL